MEWRDKLKVAREIKKDIEEISASKKDTQNIVMDFPLFDRMVSRMNKTSKDCSQCKEYLENLKPHFEEIKESGGITDRSMKKQHRKLRDDIVKHLKVEHSLYRSGYFMSIYMALGLAIGLATGIMTGNSISYLIAGAAVGYVVGIVNENKVKNKGKII